MNDDQFNIISEKLDLITKALLLNLTKDLDFKQRVLELSKLGLKEAEIVKILAENRGRVHMTLMRQKKN